MNAVMDLWWPDLIGYTLVESAGWDDSLAYSLSRVAGGGLPSVGGCVIVLQRTYRGEPRFFPNATPADVEICRAGESWEIWNRPRED